MSLTVDAPAKLNLTLEVLGRRPDGYHDILTVMQTIDLSDTLAFAPADDIELTCNVPELLSADNLVVRAAEALRAAYGSARGAKIHLEKRIPAAAGLGGGSSDAAATLKGLSQLWLSGKAEPDRLLEIAVKLGMDVTFFLRGGTALASGRGEIVEPLPPMQPTWFVLLYPHFEVPNKTALMYRSLSPADYTSGEATRRLVTALRVGGALEDYLLFNIFESVAGKAFVGIDEIRHRFGEIAKRPVHMSGAGPTLFCLASGQDDSSSLREKLRSQGFTAYSCKSLSVA